jgi:metal-responsive CopG/Arc/MetJ family transcriptional regulator
MGMSTLRKATIKITLTQEAKDMLGKLAKRRGLSRAAVVETLIRNTVQEERRAQEHPSSES